MALRLDSQIAQIMWHRWFFSGELLEPVPHFWFHRKVVQRGSSSSTKNSDPKIRYNSSIMSKGKIIVFLQSLTLTHLTYLHQ